MNLPKDFINKYQALLGQPEAAQFLASFDQPVEKGFRINPMKADLVTPLVPTAEPIAYVKGGYFGTVKGNSIAHTSGGVYSQEPSAMYVGAVVDPQPGEVILDLCAAPGGKSTYIGSQMAGQGVLVANEINAKRAKVLAENVERFGLKNAIVTNETPDRLAAAWPQQFDKILVDAPCSGEGMFRKDPEAMTYWQLAYPETCAARQKEILTAALKMLKPGGQLIYSTCTFAPEEDEQVMAWVLAQYPALSLKPIQKYAGMSAGRPEWADGTASLANAVRLWPHLMRGEGHFIACLQSNASPEKTSTRAKKGHSKHTAKTSGTLTKAQQTLVEACLAQTFKQPVLDFQYLRLQGDHLHLVPQSTLPLTQLKILRNGLNVGVFKKNRFELDHDLALSLPAAAYQVVYEVDETAYQHYRHGESLTLAQPLAAKKTFGLLTYQHLGFAIGNFVGTQVKNFYPKGLRN
ncbi:RsmB/NOP family class I SAM-dependent RNA methyltransferase [Agrilactobacillus yilanensis]|uniref:RsmB/NOP family class I SAM-dependent RNA methyltransferase n=1 Tax=Agrilactobacillus yilanensis TaxID=2485997 RepID=A0ABW4J773_9LACO|nr:RsmF rRNA methyltransferase first C-terminal domain-containing protein [Agrilactobacillus yilanensis]